MSVLPSEPLANLKLSLPQTLQLPSGNPISHSRLTWWPHSLRGRNRSRKPHFAPPAHSSRLFRASSPQPAFPPCRSRSGGRVPIKNLASSPNAPIRPIPGPQRDHGDPQLATRRTVCRTARLKEIRPRDRVQRYVIPLIIHPILILTIYPPVRARIKLKTFWPFACPTLVPAFPSSPAKTSVHPTQSRPFHVPA